MTDKPSQPRPADLEITATVKAKELSFHEAPDTSVVFTGSPGHQSSSGSDRANLPDRVEEGITYREVRVDYSLSCKVAEPRLLGSPDQTH